MNILILKTIFVHNNKFIQTNIESINSFKNFINNNKNKINMKLFGWVYNNDDSFLKNLDVDYYLFANNYGKMYLLNNIKNFIKNYAEYDIILYADHDIIINDISLLDNHILNYKVNDKQIALCSFNQYPNNRHSAIVYSNKIIINDITYYYHNNNVFIASGCFIMLPYFVNYLETIQNSNIMYGNEDILIGRTVNDNNLISLISSKSIIHPYDNDKEYEIWKQKEILKLYNIN